MKDKIISEARENMAKSLNAFQVEVSKLRTGRASLGILDDVRVEYYGQLVPLNQVATLGVPEPRLITLSPWEQKLIPVIEKAIEKANLGLTPINDGKLIRLPIPALTEERRKELIKKMKQYAEEARVSMRHARREALDVTKKNEKSGHLSEDDSKKLTTEVQKVTDEFTAKIDESVHRKEKEIMTI